jgi:hypothetical protein
MVWAGAGLVQSNEGFQPRYVVDVDAPEKGAALEDPSVAPRLIREQVERPARPQGRTLHEDLEAPATTTPPVAPGGGADTDSLTNGGMGGSGRSAEP